MDKQGEEKKGGKSQVTLSFQESRRRTWAKFFHAFMEGSDFWSCLSVPFFFPVTTTLEEHKAGRMSASEGQQQTFGRAVFLLSGSHREGATE